MVEDFLELGRGFAALMSGQVRFPAHIDGMQSGGQEGTISGSPQLVGSGALKSFDDLRSFVAVERELSAARAARRPFSCSLLPSWFPQGCHSSARARFAAKKISEQHGHNRIHVRVGPDFCRRFMMNQPHVGGKRDDGAGDNQSHAPRENGPRMKRVLTIRQRCFQI